jgi:hypothetical protein
MHAGKTEASAMEQLRSGIGKDPSPNIPAQALFGGGLHERTTESVAAKDWVPGEMGRLLKLVFDRDTHEVEQCADTKFAFERQATAGNGLV